MTASAKYSALALLRRARSGLRLAGFALDRWRELGLRSLASRAVRRCRMPEMASTPTDAEPGPGTRFDVIYAIGYWPGEPKRYRVFNMAEGLRTAGYAVHVMPFEQLDNIARRQWRARALVLFRAEYDRLVGTEEILAYARAAGMRVVYDIDDLVFEPQLTGRIDGLRWMGSHERHRFIAAMVRCRRLLLACDYVTVTTAPLARAVAALGRPSTIIPNTINGEQLRLAEELCRIPGRNRDMVRIAYFSGSRTHQRDFAVCEPGLLNIMESHPNVTLRLVGYLELGLRWQRYGSRVEKVPFLPPADMLRSLAETDINIAPLELGNPFCEAKSELKFFEAAIVGVPTVASATEPFRDAIEDGVSGFAVRDDAGWRDALQCLILSEGHRQEIGAAAKAVAIARYALPAVVPHAVAALGLGQPIEKAR